MTPDTVRQLGEALDRAERAEAAIERARDALDSVGVLHPVAADRVLRALDGPQDAASAPVAPGQPGRGERGSGGRTAALARVIQPGAWPEKQSRSRHWVMAQEEAINHAEAMLAHPDLLAALAEAGVLREVTAPLKRNRRGEWTAVYDGNHTTEGRRYVTAWEATDARP